MRSPDFPPDHLTTKNILIFNRNQKKNTIFSGQVVGRQPGSSQIKYMPLKACFQDIFYDFFPKKINLIDTMTIFI